MSEFNNGSFQDLENSLRMKNLTKNELNFKFVVIGDFGVGKTSIVGRYTDGEFSTTYKVTIGTDFALKSIEWDNDLRVNLQIWDIAGHERFGYLTGVFYRYAIGAILVFDLTRPETFASVPKWLEDLRNKVSLPGGKPVPVIILANKGDVAMKNVPEQMDAFCKANKILAWFITSAKANIHIDDAMMRLVNAAIQHHYSLQIDGRLDNDVVRLVEPTAPEKNLRNCCQR